MKTKTILYLHLFLVILTSCSYDFNLDNINVSEKMVLYCMPCRDRDTTLIQLSRSLPVSPKEEVNKTVSNARVTFSVNGLEQTVHYADTVMSSVPAGYYYVLGRWQVADIIRIRAEANGFPPISSKTTIPAGFPLKKVDMVQKQDTDNRLQFHITFQDKKETEDYYGVRIARKIIYEDMTENKSSEFNEAIDLELDDEPLLNPTGLNAIFDLSHDFYQYLYIWDDKKVQGKEYTIRLNTYYTTDWEPDEWNNSRRRIFYKIYLYSLSPELYRYLKSLNDIENNDLGHKGLAPIRSNYSNVENGIGILGGCGLMETEWLKNISPD